MRKLGVSLTMFLLLTVLSCAAKGNEETFRQFISYCPEWRETNLDDSIFARREVYAPNEILRKVIPFDANTIEVGVNQDSLAIEEGIAWIRLGHRVTTPNFIAVFAQRGCDCNNQLATDFKLYTFTKEGRFIDSLICGRNVLSMEENDSPEYYFHITSSDSRSSFHTTQYISTGKCDMAKGESKWVATDYEIRIQEDGQITKTKGKNYPTVVYGKYSRQYPDSIFAGNKTIPLGEHWLVAPQEITKEEFLKLIEKSLNLQAEPSPYKNVSPKWKKIAKRLASRSVLDIPTQSFSYKELGMKEIRFPQGFYMKSLMMADNGKADTAADSLLHSESRAVSPIGIYAGTESMDCDPYTSIFFYAYDKAHLQMKPLFQYKDYRYYADRGGKMYWISPRELVIEGRSKGNGVNYGDYMTKGLKPKDTPIYYRLRLICLPGSYLQSILPEELQQED